MSVDIKNKILSQLFNKIDFDIYFNKESQLKYFYNDCQNYNISISTPFKGKDFINLDLVQNFYEQGYDIYNLSSEFYNDICAPININDSDLIIKDRIEIIFPTEISFCPNECTLNYIDIQNQRFNCSCHINFSTGFLEIGEKYGFNFDKEKMINSITLKNSNFDILKCFKVLFNKKNLVYNIGNYILSFIILIYIVGIFLFYFKEYKKFFKRIHLLIKNILEDKNKNDDLNDVKIFSVKKAKEKNTQKALNLSIIQKSK
jgi:hypothetical protein